jgi:hypothetical protein
MKLAMAAIIILLCLVFAPAVQAQTGIPVNVNTEAMGFNYNGWSVANFTTAGADVVNWGAQKNNVLTAEFDTLQPASSLNFAAYLAGLKVTPDISGLLAKTNLPSGLFTVFGRGAFGESIFTDGTGNRFTAMAGGGVGYRATPTVGFTIVDAYCTFIGDSTCHPTIAGGVALYFNQGASPSMAVKKMLLRAKLRQ